MYLEPIVLIIAKMYFSKQISNDQSKESKGFFADLWDKIIGGRAEVENICVGDDIQACFTVISKTLKGAEEMLRMANETFAGKRGEQRILP